MDTPAHPPTRCFLAFPDRARPRVFGRMYRGPHEFAMRKDLARRNLYARVQKMSFGISRILNILIVKKKQFGTWVNEKNVAGCC